MVSCTKRVRVSVAVRSEPGECTNGQRCTKRVRCPSRSGLSRESVQMVSCTKRVRVSVAVGRERQLYQAGPGPVGQLAGKRQESHQGGHPGHPIWHR
jgi:hypothetical protein